MGRSLGPLSDNFHKEASGISNANKLLFSVGKIEYIDVSSKCGIDYISVNEPVFYKKHTPAKVNYQFIETKLSIWQRIVIFIKKFRP